MKAEKSLLNKIGADAKLKDVKIGKFKLHYLEAGKGEPIVLIHGANIGWGQWHKNIDLLAKSFKVYALDLPGAGKSTRLVLKDQDIAKIYVESVHKFLKKKKIKGAVL